jgi:hypothetical protein
VATVVGLTKRPDQTVVKLSETVVVQGNAPHNRPSFLVCHLIGNRASFLCTKAPRAPLQPGDEQAGEWPRERLIAMDAAFVERVERAFLSTAASREERVRRRRKNKDSR